MEEEQFSKEKQWLENYLKIHEKSYDVSFVKPVPSDWIEENIFLPDGVSRYKGRFKYDISPYSREIVDLLHPESPIRMIAVMKCAQIGLTQGLIVPGMIYKISQDPAPMMFTAADKELAKRTIIERFEPILQSSNLSYLIRPNVIKAKNQRSGDTAHLKEFAGGTQTIEGTNNVDKLRQISIRDIFADDWDSAPRNDKKEGAIIKLLEGRQTSYGNLAKTFYVSTPTVKGKSNIEDVYLMGDQRKWNWKCPHCEEYIPLEWRIELEDGTYAGIVYKLNSQKELIRESVGYKCQLCGGIIKESMKYDLNKQGKWIPTAKPVLPEYRSYHLNAIVIPPGFITWVDLVNLWLEACPSDGKIDSGKLKSFKNIRLGETWEELAEKPKSSLLINNQRDYNIGEVPDVLSDELQTGQIKLLTLAVDLNGIMERGNEDVRLDWEVIAHTETRQTYSIEHGSIGTFKRTRHMTSQERKNDSNRDKWTYNFNMPFSVWDELLKIMNKVYFGMSGEEYSVDITLIDTGNFTKLANVFIGMYRGEFNVVGIKGKGVKDEITNITKDSPSFALSRENKSLYLLEVNQIKDKLSANMQLPEGDDGYQPSGFMNFPLSADGLYNQKNYFSHFEGESRREVIKNDSVTGYSWQKNNSVVNNHFWDVYVYNLIAPEIYLHIFKSIDSKFRDLTWQQLCEII